MRIGLVADDARALAGGDDGLHALGDGGARVVTAAVLLQVGAGDAAQEVGADALALVNERQVGAQELDHGTLGVGVGHVGLHNLHDVVVVAQEDVVLGGNVVVEGGLGDAAGGADVLNLHRVKAPLVEQLQGRVLDGGAIHSSSPEDVTTLCQLARMVQNRDTSCQTSEQAASPTAPRAAPQIGDVFVFAQTGDGFGKGARGPSW